MSNRIYGVGDFPHDPIYPMAVQKHISFDLARFVEETDNSHQGFFYYVKEFPAWLPGLNARYSKAVNAYIVQSPTKLEGFMPIEYYVVRDYFKVGY